MARRVFFSFHYENDVWRAGQVRNCWVGREREAAGFWDAAAWEKVRRLGDDTIKRWIDAQMSNTSVTVVLIGTETADRPYVNYEIRKSYERGNGLLGIWIHNIKDQYQRTAWPGRNPFDNFTLNNGRTSLSSLIHTYDWVNDQGYANCARWIEAAAKQGGAEKGPANFGVKLMRPGFGAAAELPTHIASATASRRLQFASRGFATPRRQPPRRSRFGARDRPHSLHQGRSMKTIVKGGPPLC